MAKLLQNDEFIHDLRNSVDLNEVLSEGERSVSVLLAFDIPEALMSNVAPQLMNPKLQQRLGFHVHESGQSIVEDEFVRRIKDSKSGRQLSMGFTLTCR